MYENKNMIIIMLSILLIMITIAYIILNNEKTKEPKPIVKTVVEEKIVYVEKTPKIDKSTIKKDIEKKTEEVSKEEIQSELPDVEVSQTEDNEYIVTSTKDNNGRFTIELISLVKPPKKAFYDRKIILESQIEAEEYKAKFLFLVPPVLLENISYISIKITDAVSGESYVQTAYCVDGIDPTYRYSMNIFFSDGFSCYVQELGEIIKFSKSSELSTKKMQEAFNK